MLFMPVFATLSASLLFLCLLGSSSCSSNFITLSLNTQKVFSLEPSKAFTFRIKGDPSSSFGTFYISAKTLGSEAFPALLLISNQNCENEGDKLDPEKFPSKQVFHSEGSFVVSFNLNASIDQCFNIKSMYGTHPEPANYSMLVTFTPVTVFELNKPSSFEVAPDSEKEFACELSNKKLEMVLISISSQEDYFELREFEGFCVKTFFPGSWLCYIKNIRIILKFSLYNRSPQKSHMITISEVWTQRVDSDIEGLMFPSIPGFGTFFAVNLPFIGVLKIQATCDNNKSLPVMTSISLPSLIAAVSHQKDRLFSLDSDEEFALISNSQADTEWYYFVPENETKRFFVSSSFQKVVAVEIDAPTVFYIDPKINEYQLVQVKLDLGRVFEKYQVTLFSESNTSMSLYYNQYSFRLECILDQKKSSICKCGKQFSSSSAENVSFTFEAEPLDSVVYLIIKVSKRGFYTLEVTKYNSESILKTVLFFSSLIYSVICFIWYAYKLKIRKRASLSMEESSSGVGYPERMNDPDLQTQPDLEMNRVQSFVLDHRFAGSVEFLPSLRGMVEKLKRREERDDKRKQEIDPERCRDIEKKKSNQDEEPCDICYEKRKVVTFEPCAHTCACIFCAIIIVQTSGTCPLCRARILEIKISDDNHSNEIEEKREKERSGKENE